MLTQSSTAQALRLSPGEHWHSFEQLRTAGVNAIHKVTPGTVGTLQTKNGQYRLLTEADFQKLVGVAGDIERLQQGLNVVMRAIRVVQNHPEDSETLALLVETVTMLGMDTVLPTRSSFPPLELENIAVESDDEVTIDPAQIQRPLG